ncbi:cobalt-precorrin-6A reductase [Gloeocapsopsis dulcis]|uniref:Cobalt-precorrin-6A reductase n=1 Tax=Gloeocapsopsis dulcis AAB1 = 1H9 TaxID=1433147 RepID=A0A6N8FSU3_9CHRO|nr:cobalt-precorrin-6A reductase [Gloeocapsopsis dulcis]MUL35257.1 cobalt-precorrin-6A reductase [Gloeocapsopsis dulcis AAB1 = 1H9]WNN89139.1 cobalt-precorrin-6A reductase [Gloeocapsopsis dulcis]
MTAACSQSVPADKSYGKLWLIGGTQESVEITRAIASENIGCIVSVTTESARSLYHPASCLTIWVGRLTLAQIPEFIQQQQIRAIVDASHPYAVEVSQNAIAVAQQLQIPYLRYERPILPSNPEIKGEDFDSFEALLTTNYLQSKRVLLTVGYRPLQLFQAWHDRATLFARILPSTIALEAATQAGFTPDRLICLRPPISVELELALWHQWQIQLVITKASGKPGGEDTKRLVATQLGIPLIAIRRPTVKYPQQTSDLSVVLDFCR